MIEYFNTYVRIDNGFIAVKGEFICICRLEHGRCEAIFYRNRQQHKRAIAGCFGSNIRWCREKAVQRMKILNGDL